MTLAPEDPRHGTINGYNNLGCRCEACQQARREYEPLKRASLAYRRRRGERPLAEYRAAIAPKHGTESRYTNRGCRCDDCRRASREARARRRKAAA